jgi:hypothetical protein
MSSTQIRQRLHEYIRFADKKKVKAIYTMLENEIEEKHEIWTEAFVAEMERREIEIESGKINAKSRQQVNQKARALLKRK